MKFTELPEFIVKSKKAGYASGADGSKLPDGSREFVFREGLWVYRDRYYGFSPFGGIEVVSIGEDNPVWTMGYYGLITSSVVPAKKIYDFLESALRNVTVDMPFRGPETFRKGERFAYTNCVKGNLNSFKGKELIFHEGACVYTLEYIGGLVKGRLRE